MSIDFLIPRNHPVDNFVVVSRYWGSVRDRAAGIAEALELRPEDSADSSGRVDLLCTGLSWDERAVTRHGGTFVAPWRRALTGYPLRPEECTDTGSGEFLLDGELVVCPSCGLDRT